MSYTQYTENLETLNFETTNLGADIITSNTVGGSVTFNSPVVLNEDVIINGSLSNIESLDLIISDPFIYLNSGSTSGVPINSGLVLNSVVTGLNDTAISSVSMTITTIGFNTFSSNDLIDVKGIGIYEVQSHIGNQLLLRSTTNILPFTQKVLKNITAPTPINKIFASSIRNNGATWDLGYGSDTATYNFSTVISGTVTLQSAYDASAPPEIDLTNPIKFKDNLVPLGSIFEITDSSGNPYFEISNLGSIFTVPLSTTSTFSTSGLTLSNQISNPGGANTLWVSSANGLQIGSSNILKVNLPVTTNSVLTFNVIDGLVNSTSIQIIGQNIFGALNFDVNQINEAIINAGVTIDSVLLKDNIVTSNQVNTDIINEKILNAGVTIDGVLLKDNIITSSQVNTDVINAVGASLNIEGVIFNTNVMSIDVITEKTLNSGVTVENVLLRNQNVFANSISANSIISLGPSLDIEGINFNSGVLSVNVINENTLNAGVTIDGVLLKDNIVTSSQTNTDVINENTLNAGVTIDGVLLKDNTITSSQINSSVINESTLNAGVTIDGVLLKDNLVNASQLTCNQLGADTIVESTLNAGVTIDGVLLKDNNIELPAGGSLSFNGTLFGYSTGTGALSFEGYNKVATFVPGQTLIIGYEWIKLADTVIISLNGNQRTNTATFDYYRVNSVDLNLAIQPTKRSYHRIIGQRLAYGQPDDAGGMMIIIGITHVEIWAEGDDKGIYDGTFPNGDTMGPYRNALTYFL